MPAVRLFASLLYLNSPYANAPFQKPHKAGRSTTPAANVSALALSLSEHICQAGSQLPPPTFPDGNTSDKE